MYVAAVRTLLVLNLGCIRICESIEGWTINHDYHYYFSPHADNAVSSRRRCQDFGADLLSIADANEMQYINSSSSGRGYTIGLHTDKPCDDCEDGQESKACVECRKKWEWQDRSEMHYENWDTNQPNGEHECARTFGATGKWRRLNCQDNGYKYICKTIDHCLSSPCVHGTCEIAYSRQQFHCVCETCYTGPRCDTDNSGCASFPCRHGGTCQKQCDTYSCECPATYTGEDCSEDVDECAGTTPCMNDGTCINSIGGYSCTCTSSWTGVMCTEDIDECKYNTTCEDGKMCHNTKGGYECREIGAASDEDLRGLRTTLYTAAALAGIAFSVLMALLVNDRREVKAYNKLKEEYRAQQNEQPVPGTSRSTK